MILLNIIPDKCFGIIGLGRTGLAALHSLLLSEAHIMVWDDGPTALKSLKDKAADPSGALDLLVSQALIDGRLMLQPDVQVSVPKLAGLIVSPGLSTKYGNVHPVIAAAKEQKVPILSDVDLLQSVCQRAHYIGITGTNGKSTTTALIGHIYKNLGKKVEVGGNIGIPVLDLEPLMQDGTYVLELSSFQLELGDNTRIDTAILLNITPDHLDRYPGMDEYIAAKIRIFETQKGVAIISMDHEITAKIAQKLIANGKTVIPISATKRLKEGVSVTEGTLADRLHGEAYDYKLPNVPSLLGRHNAENLAAAYAACRANGLSGEGVISALGSFAGLPHRMQKVASIGELIFINDSKATNVDSARRSLEAFDQIIWIAGGISKDAGIEELSDLFPKLQHVYLIGKAASQFSIVLAKHKVPHTLAETLAKAMEMIKQADYKQGTVLLAPACASLDQWKSFEERGEAFADMAKKHCSSEWVST